MTNTDKHQSHLSLAPQLQPSKTLLENWKLWLAYEVITQLKNSQAVELDLTSICTDLGTIDSRSDVFSTVFQKFSQKVNCLKTQIYSLEEINYSSRIELEQFYNKAVFQHLHKVGQDWQMSATQHLQSSLSKDISQASPEKLMTFLEDLIEFLFLQKQYFEEQRIDNVTIEQSASKALNNLHNLSLGRDSMWNAISIIFESKFQKDVCSICSQINLTLIQLCQSYCQLSRRSLMMLEKIETSIKGKCTIDLVSIPVFTLLKKIDIVHQRSLIELWMGHKINYWGDTTVSWQQLESKLLQNVEYSAQELYLDFRACFLKEINISEDLN